MLICIAADKKYFYELCLLITSITLLRSDNIEAIAVYDLGLSSKQRKFLENSKWGGGGGGIVSVHDVELVHPKLLTPVEDNSNGWGYGVPGSRAWKPVVIKQALDIHPEVLYLDAGHIIAKPLDNLIEHIHQNGYFLYGTGHSIKAMTTKRMINKFNLLREDRRWILDPDTNGLQSNIIGVTRDSNIYDDFVMPLYELSKEIDIWVDDGTAPGKWGSGPDNFNLERDGAVNFGACRSQAIFSIMACLNNISILDAHRPILKIQNKEFSTSDYYRPAFIIDHQWCPEKKSIFRFWDYRGWKPSVNIFHTRAFFPELFFLMYKKKRLFFSKYIFRNVAFMIKLYVGAIIFKYRLGKYVFRFRR